MFQTICDVIIMLKNRVMLWMLKIGSGLVLKQSKITLEEGEMKLLLKDTTVICECFLCVCLFVCLFLNSEYQSEDSIFKLLHG